MKYYKPCNWTPHTKLQEEVQHGTKIPTLDGSLQNETGINFNKQNLTRWSFRFNYKTLKMISEESDEDSFCQPCVFLTGVYPKTFTFWINRTRKVNASVQTN